MWGGGAIGPLRDGRWGPALFPGWSIAAYPDAGMVYVACPDAGTIDPYHFESTRKRSSQILLRKYLASTSHEPNTYMAALMKSIIGWLDRDMTQFAPASFVIIPYAFHIFPKKVNIIGFSLVWRCPAN